jgi:hypothetical protein
MTLRKKMAAIALAFGLAATGVAVAAPAPPADAQILVFGGKVTLSKYSTGNLKVAGGLDMYGRLYKPIGWLAPGQNSRTHAHIYDTDGFQAPYGCRTSATLGGRLRSIKPGAVVKINDLTHTMVTVKC